MIISDQHRFIFIHIPKCAGTSVRNTLRPYDDTNGSYDIYIHPSGVGLHPALGRIDYVHIPLFILRSYFAQEYHKLQQYETYAVLRDPFARLPSSLSQRLRLYGKQPLFQMTAAEVRAELEKAMKKLQDYRQPQAYLPYDYIHFQRQVDFVFDQGKPLVRNLYTTDRVHAMLSDIGLRHGVNVVIDSPEKHRANETLLYKNRLIGSLVEALKPGLRRVMSRKTRQALWHLSKGILLTPAMADPNLKDIFESEYVRDFVTDYYKEDIDLFNKISKCERQTMPGDEFDARRSECER